MADVIAKHGYSCRVNEDKEFTCILSVQTSMDSLNKFLGLLRGFENSNKNLSASKTSLNRKFEFNSFSPKL